MEGILIKPKKISFSSPIMLILFVGLLSWMAFMGAQKKTGVVYFYATLCESCKEEKETAFRERLAEAMPDGRTVEGSVRLEMYDIYSLGGRDKLREYTEKLGIPGERTAKITDDDEFVFIGGGYLDGAAAIEEGLDSLLADKGGAAKPTDAAKDSDGDSAASAAIPESTRAEGDKRSVAAYFFVSPCESCEEAAKFFATLERGYDVDMGGERLYSELAINKYNANEPENLELLFAYFRAYDVPEKRQSAPIIFIGDKYFQSAEDIAGGLESAILSGEGLKPAKSGAGGLGDDPIASYNLLSVFAMGLVNGLNPCSMSMLLFFLSMFVSKQKNMLRLGFSFIIGKFIAFIAIGTILYSVLAGFSGAWFANFNFVIKLVLLLVSAFLAIMNLRDFFAVKAERYDKVKMQLPAAVRRLNHSWIKKISGMGKGRLLLLLCFLLGAVIAVGEFLCTGQIYLAVIVYTLKTSPDLNVRAILYFVTYGVAFVIPLIALLLIISKGKEVFDVSEMVRGRLGLIKLINAFVFAAFFIIVLFLF